MQHKVLNAFFTFDNKIPSVNEYYKRSRHGIYLNPEVHMFKDNITHQLMKLYPNKDILIDAAEDYGAKQFRVKIVYLLNSKRAMRDEDNLRKATQDAVFKYFNAVDDMQITGAVTDRALVILPKDSYKEFILFQVYVHDETRIYDLSGTGVPTATGVGVPFLGSETVDDTHHFVEEPIYSIPYKECPQMELKEQLTEALKKYTAGEPTGISDPDFDDLVRQYGYDKYITEIKIPTMSQGAESQHPSWTNEFLPVQPPKIKVEHADQIEFDPKTEVKTFKFDGSSVCAYYTNGKVTSILTRGSDYAGKNQTDKLKNLVLNNVDPRITLIQYEALTCLEDYGDTCRSKANGLINSKDMQAEVDMALILIPFQVITNVPMTYQARMDLIDRPTCIQEDPESPYVKTERGTVPIDGIVIYDNTVECSDTVNPERNAPVRIFKFYGVEKVESEVTNIEWNCSNLGVYIPKLVIKEVVVGGSHINKIASGGIDKMMQRGLGIGAKIQVIKSGGVIPQVYGVLEQSHNFAVPVCPNCGNKMTKYQTGVHCEAPGCSAESERVLQKFLSSTHSENLEALRNSVLLRGSYHVLTCIGVPRIRGEQWDALQDADENNVIPGIDEATIDAWEDRISKFFSPKQNEVFHRGMITYKALIKKLYRQ